MFTRWVVVPIVLLVWPLFAFPQESFTVEGRFQPPAAGAVTLDAATNPFTTSALSDAGGRFRFRKIPAGTHTLSIFVPNRGELRKTVVVTTSTADSKRRVRLEFDMHEATLERESALGVSVRALSISEKAKAEFREALKKLSRNDVAQAEAHLEKAIEISPQFAEAWNRLGTIAYQTQRYALAEERFRKALEVDSEAYAPLVNLGGVPINLERFEDAERYNRLAVLRQPDDALAHSQLGMALLYLGKLDEAEKPLREAIRLDPAHFSHPQIHLAEVMIRKGKPLETAQLLEDFLKQHPDSPGAKEILAKIAQLRSAAN
jgi:tetratricopeptide (TPR) repeat protein